MRRRLLSLLLAVVMVLGMLPVSAFATEAPFGVTVGDAEMTGIEESTLTWTHWDGSDMDVTCYTVIVPEGSDEATLEFAEEVQWAYYDSMGNYIGEGDTSWTAADSHTVAIQDANGDGELDGISVQIPNAFSAEYVILFVYGSDESGDSEVSEPSDPFLNIKIGDVEVAAENIAYKGIFAMGDYDEDEQQETADSYDYVHEVPYYHVSVPCGTTSVDVTYSSDTNIMNSGSDAYGYKTDLEVDAVSSATVRGTTINGGYTKNDDGTQTVKTPVTSYTFDADGNGHAITLEENDAPFAAVCLFSFEYDGLEHVYDGEVTTAATCTAEGVKTFTCSCGDSYSETVAAIGHSYADGICANCGEADPDYVASGAEIPEGTNIQSITDVTEFAEGEEIEFTLWGMVNGPVPSYIATVPEGTREVTLTFVSGSYPAPFEDYYTGQPSISGGWVTYHEEEDIYSGSGTSHQPTAVDDTHSIELNAADMIASGKYYCAYDSMNSPMYLLGFKYPEGAHEHSYTEEVTTEPGCETTGVRTFTCSCGDSYTEDLASTGHNWNDGAVTVPATCVAEGTKTITCTECGATKTEPITKLGHQYDEGTVTTEATCTEPGVKTFTCSQCAQGVDGHTRTEAVSATGHAYANGECLKCGDVCPVIADGVYQIGTANELLWFANEVNGGNKAISASLTADITLDSSWSGIGNATNKFAGSFDGQNHTVTLDGSTYGLFGYTMGAYDSNGNTQKAVIIENVILEGSTVNSALIQYAGYTYVTNCINRADVTGGNREAAGIVGAVCGYSLRGILYSDVQIQNCGNEGDINGGLYTAGIVGFTQTNTHLTGCYNTGHISGTTYRGGIAGYFQGSSKSSTISNCYNGGTVTGDANAGGLVGILYNGATIQNSYNAGETAYGIIGSAYSKNKGTIKNSYYLASASTMGIPADHSGSYEFAAKTQAEMNEESFLTALGSSFKLSCPTPVLYWQETVEHTGVGDEDGCDVCGYGSNVKKSFPVTIHKNDAVSVTGGPTATEEGNYTFTVTVNKGYRKTDSFAVKVNGNILAESDTPDTFVYENVQGPLTITVEGVEKIPATVSVSLPNGEGKGYRVSAVSGSTTVTYGGDFKFKVTLHENFQMGSKFRILVNGSEEVTPDANGVCTLTNVCEDKTITVSDVLAKPYGDTADIQLTITYGEHELYKTPETGSDQLMLHTELEVPYFDIGLYGMSHCYYNPDCYGFNADGTRKPQTGGTAESAYGIITPLHAFIYATEVHYLNVPADKAGTGWSYEKGTFQDAIRWSGGVGSIFMYLWDHGSNLNYYVNYEYPLGAPGWGSTSDQIALNDGDIISAHMIASGDVDENGNANVETSAANGSAYGVFVVDDTNGSFDYGSDTIHSYEVKQGEKVDLTLFSSVATSTYDTAYTTLANRQLYWIHDDYLSGNMTEWNEGEGMVTDRSGRYILDTTDFEPGVYYIGALGGFTEGDGKPDAGGFVSAGYERGVAVLKLTITEGEGGSEKPAFAEGDMNGDGYLTADDSAAAFAACKSTEGLTEVQIAAADVTGDGYITADDAAMIFAMSKGGAN